MSGDRVLICGGRDVTDEAAVFRALDAEHARCPIGFVVEGDGTGLDRIARAWAKARGLGHRSFRADWNDLSWPDARIKRRRDGSEYDAQAGPRRNQRMLDEGAVSRVIAFPRANGRIGEGTADMMRRARRAGIEPTFLSLNT